MGKKRKNYYVDKSALKKQKTSNYNKLTVGVNGFIISHDKGKAQPCTKNTFQLLNHYADCFYGEYKGYSSISGDNSDVQNKPKDALYMVAHPEIVWDEKESDTDDIDAALAKEVSSLQKSVKSAEQKTFRFYRLKSGCNNMIFIKVNDIKPSLFLYKLVKDLVINSNSLFATPSILRIHPVDVTCKAHLVDIQTMAETYIPKGLNALWEEVKGKENLSKEFGIVFRQRNNNHLSKADVRSVVVSAARDSCSGWVFNSNAIEFLLIIEVIQVVCGMGVSYDYFDFKKLNIHELRLSIQTVNTESASLCNADTASSANITPRYDEQDAKNVSDAKIMTKVDVSDVINCAVSKECIDDVVYDEDASLCNSESDIASSDDVNLLKTVRKAEHVCDTKTILGMDIPIRAVTLDSAMSKECNEDTLIAEDKCMSNLNKDLHADTNINPKFLNERALSNRNLDLADDQSDKKNTATSSDNCV